MLIVAEKHECILQQAIVSLLHAVHVNVCLSSPSSRAVAEALRGIAPGKPPENLFSDALLLSGVCVLVHVLVCVC